MGRQKVLIHFFTDADYLEEEVWLREKNKKGLKLVQKFRPGIYVMEECEPQDIIYRKDFTSHIEDSDYINLLESYGWEKIFYFHGSIYLKKVANEEETIEEQEILSNDESRLEMVKHLCKSKIVPLGILLTLDLPVLINLIIKNGKLYLQGVLASSIVVFIIWLYVFLHSLVKIRGKKKDLERHEVKCKVENSEKVTKVIVTILLIGILVRITIFSGISASENIKRIDVENTSKIILMDMGDRDNKVEIYDEKTIDNTKDMIFANEYNKMLLGPNGFMQYSVEFYDSNNTELATIVLVTEDVIYYNNHSYRIHMGKEIDMQFFKLLLNNNA